MINMNKNNWVKICMKIMFTVFQLSLRFLKGLCISSSSTFHYDELSIAKHLHITFYLAKIWSIWKFKKENKHFRLHLKNQILLLHHPRLLFYSPLFSHDETSVCDCWCQPIYGMQTIFYECLDYDYFTWFIWT